jgi:hypothetical protein
MQEMNNTLYNWLVGLVNQETLEKHFYPNEGDGRTVLHVLTNDPAILSEDTAKVNVSKRDLASLKCKGADIHHYVQMFEHLVNKAELTDEREKVRKFTEGFSEAPPYWDKLSRLWEDQKTLKEIITSLCTYYSTNVCTLMKKREHGDEEEPAANANKCQMQKGRGKRVTDIQKNKDSDGNKKPIRIPKEVYNDLTKDEKAELKKTIKIDGHTILKEPNDKGVHMCIKTKSTKNPIKESGRQVTVNFKVWQNLKR